MSRRDLNFCSNNRESILEHENEPEEGEIVDDCELIVSSDEELCMRQRIRELEAENEEIEQIAVISRCYDDEFNENRAARVLTDASSISSTEFVTPKKRKRRKSKERKKKHCHHHHHHQHYQTHHRYDHKQLPQYNTIKTHSHTKKTQCKRRQKIIAKKQNKLHSDRYMYKEISHDTTYLYLPDSSASSSSSLTDTEAYSKNSQYSNRKDDAKNYGSFITRDTLRLAVSRSSGDAKISIKKSCLKDKLLRQELVSHASTILDNKQDLEDDADDVIEVIEPEPDIQTVDEDSSENSMEEKELRLIALKSAVMKKHMARKRRNAELAYSPTDFDGENKLNYIDMVDLEENDLQNGCVIVSPEASPQLMMLDDQDDSRLMMDCKPVDMDIVNSDSEDAAVDNWPKQLPSTMPSFSYASKEFAKQFQYSMYVHDIELPPPPPGVDDCEEIPPPPPCFRIYNSQMQDMEVENEELMKEVASEAITNHLLGGNKPLEEDGRETICGSNVKQEIKEEGEEEEDEEALRALLLSKFQSPKNPKKLEQEQNQKQIPSYDMSQSNENIENKQHLQIKPTESILKEAVKRLKVHTQTDSLNEEFCHVYEDIKGQSSKSHDGWDDQNDNESLISLSASRKRLIELRTQVTERERLHMAKQQDKQQISTTRNRESLEVKAENIEKITDLYTEKEITMEHPFDSSNSAMVTNNVDISDITRRLQEIKNKILYSNTKQNLEENSSVTNFQVTDFDHTWTNTASTVPNIYNENVKEADSNHSILKNNLQNMTLTDSDPTVISKHKIVQVDFDVTKKRKTFKVTISNSSALKADNLLLQENGNENIRNNNKPNTAINELTKTVENSQPGLEKVLALKPDDHKMAMQSETLPLLTAATPLSSYSVRTNKIVKPNKVINTNIDLKRRLLPQPADTIAPSKSSKTEPFRQIAKSNDKNRLITSFDQVKHMCKIPQFLISVQNSSNESSEDEWVEAYDTLYKPLYDYNDNASPLSLNLESPCHTPTRSNSPIDAINNHKDAGFEEKLDTFSKTVGTPEMVKEQRNEKTTQSESGKPTNTPVAVRHLPAAAQSEYRRLIHRMTLLQNQRKTTAETENIAKSPIDTYPKVPQTEVIDKNETETALKTSLVKQVLIRNANNKNSTTTDPQKNGSIDRQPPKFHKTNVLRSYESIYVKIGAGIVNHLDKSLKLVEEAKKAKISKLKLESRLKELKAEMDMLQGKHKEEQQKISRIYPNICSTNDVISSLKQKRVKVFKAALSLGRTLKGEEYRLNNDLKESITTKTKKLATTIKLVNSLKAEDIANLEDLVKINTNKEQINDRKQVIHVKDTPASATATVVEEVNEKEEKEEGEKDEIISSRENIQTKEDKTTKDDDDDDDDDDDPTLPSRQLGGNTEFQNDGPETNPKELAPDQMMDGAPATMKDCAKKPMCSYISPLEHLRNMDSNMDPNGVVCPYDLMGNCEDASCKYVHISPKGKT